MEDSPQGTRHPVPGWRPTVTLNVGMSIDGRIAGLGGKTLRFSDDMDLARVHRMRAEHAAILVGIGTVLADDPALVVKRDLVPDGPDPVRVVLDSRHRTPMTARVASEDAPTILYCTEPATETVQVVRSVRGVDIVACPTDERGRVALPSALRDLKDRGLDSLMVEGGGRVIASFLRLGAIDRLSVFVSPVVVGEGAPSLASMAAQENGDPLHAFDVVASDARPTGVTMHLAPREPPA